MAKVEKRGSGFRIRWTDENGVRRTRVLPDKKSATLALEQEKLAARERKAGLRPPETAPRTFRQAAEYWLLHRAPQKRSYKDDVSMLKQLQEQFDDLPLQDPPRWVVAVDRYKAHKAALSVKTLHNHLTLLRSVLKLAVDLGWADRVPNIKKPRVKLTSSDYSYLKSPHEVRRFLDAAAKESAMAHALFMTAIYTGMRAGELAALEWGDVNWSTRLITVQRSFEGPTKSDQVRYVPIVDALLDFLREWCLTHPGRWLFTNRDGGMLQPSGRLFQEVLHRVLQRAGFPSVKRGGKERNYLHFHDLRHTFASLWVMNGGDLFKLQKILGHQSVAMTQRYAHLQPTLYAEDHGRFPTAR